MLLLEFVWSWFLLGADSTVVEFFVVVGFFLYYFFKYSFVSLQGYRRFAIDFETLTVFSQELQPF